jgi:hypothetical protein
MRLVSIALVFAAACVVHTAPPPAAPQAGVGVPPPAGNVVFEATEGDRADCHPGQSCRLSCPHGSCDVACGAGSTCQASCDGGGCAMSCEAGATCAFSCDGGGCEQSCGQGTCAMSCDGGGCEVAGGVVVHESHAEDGDHDDDHDNDGDHDDDHDDD